MTMQATAPSAQPRNFGRSTGAIVLGFVAVVVLSLGTDEALHLLKVYPPWGQPMFEPRLNLLALSYRMVYSVIGSYIAARFAPRNPMRHAMILGAIGFVLSIPGAIFITTHADLGPVVVSNRAGGRRFAVRVAWRSPLPEEAASRGSAPGIEIGIEIKPEALPDAKNHSISSGTTARLKKP